MRRDLVHRRRRECAETVAELLEVLNDPDITFEMTPQNIMRYATFMHDVGSLKTRMTKWTDMFAPEAHRLPGN